jgi:hypothetical protein
VAISVFCSLKRFLVVIAACVERELRRRLVE